jgi:glyoxylase-like metal-dependent hydrolase (beta-lactamase superfamily II)
MLEILTIFPTQFIFKATCCTIIPGLTSRTCLRLKLSRVQLDFLFQKDAHQLTPNVQLIKTPGHTPEDITVMVRNTDKYGTIAVCGDVFVAEDDMRFPLMWKPMASNEKMQEASRKRLICDADYIVPGHGKVRFFYLENSQLLKFKVFKVTDKMRATFRC